MVALVEQMLSLHKQLPPARTSHEQTAFQRQIEATDRQIDALVYELYGLTEEEIAIVEGKGYKGMNISDFRSPCEEQEHQLAVIKLCNEELEK
jgi:hypothetical protein